MLMCRGGTASGSVSLPISEKKSSAYGPVFFVSLNSEAHVNGQSASQLHRSSLSAFAVGHNCIRVTLPVLGLQVCLRHPPAQGKQGWLVTWTSPSVPRWLSVLWSPVTGAYLPFGHWSVIRMQTRSCSRPTRLPPASRHVLSSPWREHGHATSYERACASSAEKNNGFLRAKSQSCCHLAALR